MNCATRACADHNCDNECYYAKHDNIPYGVTFLPGSGALVEYPQSPNSITSSDDGNTILQQIQNIDICPGGFANAVCIRECCEFAAAAHINFINGDLLIDSPFAVDPTCNLLNGVILPPKNDLNDIFPELLGVNGSIYVVGTSYRKISGFRKLRWVTGSIIFANNPNLISMPAFPSLLNVSTELYPSIPVAIAPSLVTSTLTCAPAAIIIVNNALLRRVFGFEALRQVKDGIFISNNPCLTHICGFIHLYRTDRVVINSNAKLSKLVGFCYTDTINVGLYIFDNNTAGEYDLTVSAFITLETAGQVAVIGNSYLKIFKLDALRTVQNSFIVRSNPQLEELSSSVAFVDNFYVENNKSLFALNFATLYEVNQQFSVSANCALLSLDTFDSLKRIGAGAIIADNVQLAEIKGFNALKYIGSTCVIAANTIAMSTNACISSPSCSCNVNFVPSVVRPHCHTIVFPIDSGFDVTAFDTLALDSCNYGLEANFYLLVCNANSTCLSNADLPVTSASIVNYSLVIYGNSRLRAIGGFSNLKHIESVLFIIFNAVLHTINAFGQLAFALDIWIRNNPSIKYIIGFNNLLDRKSVV